MHEIAEKLLNISLDKNDDDGFCELVEKTNLRKVFLFPSVFETTNDLNELSEQIVLVLAKYAYIKDTDIIESSNSLGYGGVIESYHNNDRNAFNNSNFSSSKHLSLV